MRAHLKMQSLGKMRDAENVRKIFSFQTTVAVRS